MSTSISPVTTTTTTKPKSAATPKLIEAAHLALDPEGFFASHQRDLGDPFLLELPGLGRVLISGRSDAARELFSSPPDTFEPLPNNPVEPLLGSHSMILLAGERHRKERKLMASPFNGDRMRAYGAIMCERTRAAMESFRAHAPIELQPTMQQITLEVILHAVLGMRDDDRGTAMREAISHMLASYVPPLLVVPQLRVPMLGLGPWDRFTKARDHAIALLHEEIRQRRAEGRGDREDILSLLMEARYDDGSTLTDDELVDEARTLIVAGHDTTMTALVWAVRYSLANHPTREAIEAELEPHGARPSPAVLADLPLLGAICNEALRLHPVVPIVPRRVVKPFTFCGQALEPGACVALSTTLLHRDPELWTEPDAWKPERFLEGKFGPFVYAPFGGGARRCIGAAFGLFQMRMVLGTFFAGARYEPIDEDPPRCTLGGITMGPSESIRVVIRHLA
jgi:cytochrome P450